MTIWTMKIGVAKCYTPLTSYLASHTLYTQTQLVVSWCTHSGAKKRPKKVQFKQAIGTVFKTVFSFFCNNAYYLWHYFNFLFAYCPIPPVWHHTI